MLLITVCAIVLSTPAVLQCLYGLSPILVHGGLDLPVISASKPPLTSGPLNLGVLQDHKKFLSEEPAFTLLSADLVAVDQRIQNVARYLPSVRWVCSSSASWARQRFKALIGQSKGASAALTGKLER